MKMIVKERLATALADALQKTQAASGSTANGAPEIRLDVPPSAAMGDFSSDLAVAVARASGQSVRQVAENLAANLEQERGLIQRIDISSSGILNIHLQPGWLQEVVREARVRREEFGKSDDLGQGKSVQVEFVSAYPTAPLTVLHGRGAAYGDALATVLEWNGYRVTREFYVNDAGSRFERFARSVEAEYLKQQGHSDVRPLVDGFQGEYLSQSVREIISRVGDRYVDLPAPERRRELGKLGLEAMLQQQRETLAKLGVEFDEWRSERDLLSGGLLKDALDCLREKGFVYETDGALWLRNSQLGDEADRPLVRSNGEPTYLAGDLAYHLDKYRRGFERVIDIWGPDHATYARRTRAGIQALGYSPEVLDILVLEPVTLKIDGQLVEGSSTGGNNIPLSEVIQEVGKETARFSYLLRDADAPLEFDLDQSRDDPAASPANRLRRVLEQVRQLVAEEELPAVDAPESLDADPAATALRRSIAGFPDEVRAAARELDPSRIARYALELTVQIEEIITPRHTSGSPAIPLGLLDAAAVVLGNSLTILGCAP
jgi:arginyl-tRNA synthetase